MEGAPRMGPRGRGWGWGLRMCQVRELGQRCCYTEGSATSPKVLISRLVGEAGNCHVESADLGTHTETTIPPPTDVPPPPPAQIGEGCKATNKELLNLWRRKRQEVSRRREEGGKKERGSFQGKKK